MCAMQAAALLKKRDVSARVVHASSVNRMDAKLLRELHEQGIPFYTVEENVLSGGFGGAVAEYCLKNRLQCPDHLFALRDEFIPHGSRKVLLERHGLDAEHIADVIGSRINK